MPCGGWQCCPMAGGGRSRVRHTWRKLTNGAGHQSSGAEGALCRTLQRWRHDSDSTGHARTWRTGAPGTQSEDDGAMEHRLAPFFVLRHAIRDARLQSGHLRVGVCRRASVLVQPRSPCRPSCIDGTGTAAGAVRNRARSRCRTRIGATRNARTDHRRAHRPHRSMWVLLWRPTRTGREEMVLARYSRDDHLDAVVETSNQARLILDVRDSDCVLLVG